MKGQEVLILRPTAADVQGVSWMDYITRHEGRILKSGGVCKIVMPASLNPRRQGYDNLGALEIKRAIRQHANGSRGIFRMLYVEQKPMSISEFKAMALDKDNMPTTSGEGRSGNTGPESLERKFWKSIGILPPLYGADVEGSLFDEKAKGWNLRHLDTLLSTVLDESGFKLPGVNTPYLYFGQWRSVFAWHTEDLDLYSVNYLHFGATKQWYVIPPEHGARFEYVIKSQVPEVFKTCPEFLRHKELLVSPQFLDQFQIPYMRVTQHPREFVVVYPGAYHAGFNHGYNCAESVNFATKKWIPIGARAGVCSCQSDAVKIDMRLFRHLVPANQLPEELMMDTSDEEESDGSDEDSEQSSGESDSEDSTTETMAPASSKRPRRALAARSSKATGRSKRSRGVEDEDVSHAGKKQATRAGGTGRPRATDVSLPRRPGRPRGRSAGQHEATEAAERERQAVRQAQQREKRAAARVGRVPVRERVLLRAASSATAVRALRTSLQTPTRVTTRLHVNQRLSRTARPTATAARPALATHQLPGRGTRVLQAARPKARPLRPAPTAHTAATPSSLPSTGRQRARVPTAPSFSNASAGALRTRRSSTQSQSLPAVSALAPTLPRRAPRVRVSPAAPPLPAPPTHPHPTHLHHHTADDGMSNASGVTTHTCSDDNAAHVHPSAPQLLPRPSTASHAPTAIASLTSPRPRRANAGINRWLLSDAEPSLHQAPPTATSPSAAAVRLRAAAGAPPCGHECHGPQQAHVMASDGNDVGLGPAGDMALTSEPDTKEPAQVAQPAIAVDVHAAGESMAARVRATPDGGVAAPGLAALPLPLRLRGSTPPVV